MTKNNGSSNRKITPDVAARNAKNGEIQYRLTVGSRTVIAGHAFWHMEWSEIDWDRSLWHIPATKMKADRNHTVPPAKQTLELLRTLQPLTGEGRYVFPSMRSSRRPMSENTILAALRQMGYTKEEMAPHGFRSMASTTLHDSGWDHEIIELQLAHGRRDKVGTAYDRSRRLPERIHMMQWYANFLDALETNKSPNGIVREIMDNLTTTSPELCPKGKDTFQVNYA